MGTIQSIIKAFRLDIDLRTSPPTTQAVVVFKADVQGQQKTLPLEPVEAPFEVKPSEIPALWKTRALNAMNSALDPDASGTLTGGVIIIRILPGPSYEPKGKAHYQAVTPSTTGDVPVEVQPASFEVKASEVRLVWRTRAIAAVKKILKEA